MDSTSLWIFYTVVQIWIQLFFGITALDVSQCRTALGMQSHEIPDEAITSSSSYDDASVGPSNARIRTEINGGAWCPKPTIDVKSEEWLEIDLGRLMVITMVETQGRFGNGQGQEYTEQYLLRYKREKHTDWITFHNRKGQSIFHGNSNTYLAELREVKPPMIARWLRFVPYSVHARTVCMRVELYGCEWTDAVVSYEMPQGDKRGSNVDLHDFTYDIKQENPSKTDSYYLKSGLGQLTDGQEGQSNFRLDPQGIGYKGYEWVGWKNDSTRARPVELIFKFNEIRNFTSVRLHCNNLYSKDVRVFKKAQVWFSVGGKYFNPPPIEYRYMRDGLMEFARPVKIRLQNRVGRYVKIQLEFDARWIMISEVSFESTPAEGNFTLEIPPPTTTPTTRVTPNHRHGAGSHSTDEGNDIDVRKKPKRTDAFIGIIIGSVLGFIVIVIVAIGILIVIIRSRRRKHNNNRRNIKPVETRNTTIHLNDFQPNITVNGKLSNGNMYNSIAMSDTESEHRNVIDPERCNDIYHELDDSLTNRKLPDIPPLKTPETTDYHTDTMNTLNSTGRDYAIPDITKSSMIVSMSPQQPMFESPYQKTPIIQKQDPFYATSEVINVPNIQGVSGSNVYAVPNPDLLFSEDFTIVEFPRENLKFLEKLGEGQFGEVHLAEAQHIVEFLGDDTLINRTASRSLLVAVKMLRKLASDQARADFQKEIKILSRLKDPNIVRVLGVCSKEDPPFVIVEYMKYGDLNQFLRDHIPENVYTTAKEPNAKELTYGCLIYIANQIASGMKYLESQNMVHRDLATRNCLVGHLYTIKISDFGMSRSLYSADYYRIEGRAVLPIRWMAWESILLGKFTTKSDIWSFAVTLWEILTFAKIQPYEHLTDEQVIENCGHFYRQSGQEIYLPIPANCPKEIYDLMRECWNRCELSRPTFREIHMFLQRKNMGYNPKDEQMGQSKMVLC
ncbi:discoidin domain-containing receptor 2-like isoform X2 [Tubulanus polymorphus]|uniref:discoidin domain-containing receptor 2-like isoform X2 n=1 Tax=Tubulanus polymorphus TaxID=672921 RepID=UPI003DA25AD5